MGKPTAIVSNLLLWVGVLSLAASSSAPAYSYRRQEGTIPSVDLGYEVHTATTINIPYAEQPVGNLRFSLPVLPLGSSPTVNNGSKNVMCVQAAPEWLLAQKALAAGVSLQQITAALSGAAGQTEACLVLDLYVPRRIFDSCTKAGAPVVLWIHGGGFTSGSKRASSNPPGLIGRSTLNGNTGMIYVSINYRLGLFGWLGGRKGVTPNLGLYDQAVALKWVQQYIRLFGGDPRRLTIMGESACAASILHHITAYGGATTLGVNFSQAILQFPSFKFNHNMTTGFDLVMAEATLKAGSTISTVGELTTLDSATLKSINEAVVYKATVSEFTFGPAPDGTYVPDLPQVLLAEGKFHRDIQVMPAYNPAESVTFLPTNIITTNDTLGLFKQRIPEASNETVNYVLDILYRTSSYSCEFLRAAQIVTDSVFSCSTRYLGLAFGNASYNYLFAIPPGYHAADLRYTFSNGDTSTLEDGVAVNETMAHALQDYLVGFVMTGNPNKNPAEETSCFPQYGSDSKVRVFTSAGLITATDDMDNVRCPWWQQAFSEGLVVTNPNNTAYNAHY